VANRYLANPMSENQLKPSGLGIVKGRRGCDTGSNQRYSNYPNILTRKRVACTAGHARCFDFGFLGCWVCERCSAGSNCAAVAGTGSICRTGNVDTCATVISQWTGFNRSVCGSTGAPSSGSADARNIERPGNSHADDAMVAARTGVVVRTAWFRSYRGGEKGVWTVWLDKWIAS
jgi:hypothetical protein